MTTTPDTPLGEPGQYACEDCGTVYPSTSAAARCCPDREDRDD